MDAIDTQRLRLVPLSVTDAHALVNGHRPGADSWADGYPTDGTLVAAGLVVTAHATEGGLGRWGVYQMVRRADGVILGDCGFLGPPDHRGCVHVGYGLAEPERDHDYAVEALAALVAWARAQPEATRVLADVAPTNLATVRVLEAAGLRRAGADDRLVYYEA
ncbi:MAG TPA: GNAT family N-acetyltransferase [Solirubrobacteraceae bacterium]|nr:GNAT family N-acetyltransferase [Solirubrobacteraceae bacterium]